MNRGDLVQCGNKYHKGNYIVMSDWTVYDESNPEHQKFHEWLEEDIGLGNLDGYHYGYGLSKSYDSPRKWIELMDVERGKPCKMVLCDCWGPRGGSITEWFEVWESQSGEQVTGYGYKPEKVV